MRLPCVRSWRRALAMGAGLLLATGATCATFAAGLAGSAASAPAGAPDTLLAETRADAARRAGVAEAAVTLTLAEAVTWPDGSLGCAQPDRAYTQALVPGWRVVWQAANQEWRYHAGRRGHWVWCPGTQAKRPLPGQPSR